MGFFISIYLYRGIIYTMLKIIPKSNVSQRAFQVFKEWNITDSNYQVISSSLETGLFDTGSSDKQQNIYTHPLYKSLQAKYYNQDANPFTLFGDVEDISELASHRNIGDTIYVISIPQVKYGERIKKGSVTFTDLDNEITYSDNNRGSFGAETPLYNLVSIDLDTGAIVIKDNDNETFTGTLTSMDLETGVSIMTFGTDTDTVEVVIIDLDSGTLRVSEKLDFDGLNIDQIIYGNIFYEDGLFVFTATPAFSNYSCTYKSTKTIYETEVFLNIKSGEFNFSQNPSAVEVTLSGSYDFETTAVTNSLPAGTVKIKEVQDISLKNEYYGSIGTSTGSWDDYHNSSSIDPTGSYLAPFISTIGLYDKDGDMVAVAKLPQPIKNLPDYDMNFIVRLDT